MRRRLGGLLHRRPPARGERSGDGDASQIRLHPCVAAGDAGVRPQVGLAQRLRVGRGPPHERHAQLVRPGRDRQAELPVVVDGPLPVPPGAVLVAIARRVGGRRAAGGERPDQRAVQAHLQRVRRLEDGQVVAGVAGEADANRVVGVLRKHVAERAAAARAERHPRHPVVLRQIAGEAEDLGRGRRRGTSHRNAADLARGGQVALQQRRRDAEHAGDVVEPVAGPVGWQQLRDVDLQVEEVAHGMVVLGPVQPVERLGAPGIRIGGRRPIELGLQPADEAVVGRRVRPRARQRRHRAGAQLADHGLPDVRRIGDPAHVVRVERQARRAQPLVVAGDAVAVEERALPTAGRLMLPAGGTRRLRRRGLGRASRHFGHPESGQRAAQQQRETSAKRDRRACSGHAVMEPA